MNLPNRPAPEPGLAQAVRILLARVGRHLRASAATRRRRSFGRRLIGA